MAGRPQGAVNKDKPFKTALLMELKDAEGDMPALRDIARGLIERAKSSDIAAREIADRIDGKVAQPVGGDPDNPIRVHATIERAIVRPREADEAKE